MSIYKIDTKVSFSPKTFGEDKFGRSISQRYTLDHKTVVLGVKITPIYREEYEYRGFQGIHNCRSYRDENGKLQYEDLPVKVLYLEKVKISILHWKVSFDAEKYQRQLAKAQQLADELGVDIVIKSDYVGFGELSPTDEVFYEELFDSSEMCDYLMSISDHYSDNDSGYVSDLYFLIHKGIGGQYIEGIENPSYIKVNIQSKEAYFVDDTENNILKDEDANDFILNLIDMIEDKLYIDGVLDKRYTGFVPRQFK